MINEILQWTFGLFFSPWLALVLAFVLPIWWSRHSSFSSKKKGEIAGYERKPYGSRDYLKRGQYVMRPELLHFSECYRKGEKDVYHADCRHDLWVSTKNYYIMPGQSSDGASTPWFAKPLINLLDPAGTHQIAARFHDAAYRLGFVDFHEANLDFSLMMKMFGTPLPARIVLFLAVWTFGQKAWDNARKHEKDVLAEIKDYIENPPDLGFYDVMREQIAEYDARQLELENSPDNKTEGHPGEPNA